MKRALTLCLVALLMAALPSSATDSVTLDQALAAYDDRDIDQTIKLLNELAAEDDKAVLMNLAKVEMRTGSPKKGLKATERLVKIYPNDPNVHHAHGMASLSMMSEVSVFRFVSMAKQAKAGWEKAVELDPEHLDGLYALFSYYANAPKVGGGDIEEARRLQARLASINVGYGNLALGVLHAKEERYEAAEAAFVEAARIMDTAGAYFALAQFYLDQEKFPEALEAIANFPVKPADFWDPDPPVQFLVIAIAQSGLGNPGAAETAINSGLAMKPGKRLREFFEEVQKQL